jgi:hypothetical protein
VTSLARSRTARLSLLGNRCSRFFLRIILQTWHFLAGSVLFRLEYMRRLAMTIAVTFAMTLALAVQASALDLAKLLANNEGPDKFQIIHTADLAKLMAVPNSKVQIYDANRPSTRERFGVIPGAHLLGSYDHYDVSKELPSDKSAKLVFYCADQK